MRVAQKPQALLASSSLTWKRKDSPCGWFVLFICADLMKSPFFLIGRGRHRCWGGFHESHWGSVIDCVAFIIFSCMWLEVAIKESDGLIAVISEKYMHSTYCNNGMHSCAQRYATDPLSCLQKWSWHRAQDCSSSQFFFEKLYSRAFQRVI